MEDMKKGQYGRKIETVKVGNVSCPLYLDASGTFTAHMDGKVIQDTSLESVRHKTEQMLREASTLEWKPIICVNTDDADCRVNNLEHSTNNQIYIERSYIAYDGKRWLECPWVVQRPGTVICSPHAPSNWEQHELPKEELCAARIFAARPFHATYGIVGMNRLTFPLVTKGHSGKATYIPYTEDHWQTMIGIIARFRELREKVNEMLATSDGWLMLEKVAQTKLLT